MTNALDRYFSLKHNLQMLCFYNLLVNSFKGSCCFSGVVQLLLFNLFSNLHVGKWVMVYIIIIIITVLQFICFCLFIFLFFI